jgi:hypothetical protein
VAQEGEWGRRVNGQRVVTLLRLLLFAPLAVLGSSLLASMFLLPCWLVFREAGRPLPPSVAWQWAVCPVLLVFFGLVAPASGLVLELLGRRGHHVLVRHPRLIPYDLGARVLIGTAFASALTLGFHIFAAVYHASGFGWAAAAFSATLGTLLLPAAGLTHLWAGFRHRVERADGMLPGVPTQGLP